MTHRHKIIRPFLIEGRPNYHIDFWDGPKRKRISLGTNDLSTAKFAALDMLGHLPVKPSKPRHQKSAEDPDMYIYFRKPYVVRVGKVVVGHCMTRAEARKLKDEYFTSRTA